MRAQAVKQIARYKVAPWMYNPPVLGDINGSLGAINMGNAVGGTNWPGVAYDPETHTIIANANNVGITSGSLVAPPPNFSDIRFVSGIAGRMPKSTFASVADEVMKAAGEIERRLRA